MEHVWVQAHVQAEEAPAGPTQGSSRPGPLGLSMAKKGKLSQLKLKSHIAPKGPDQVRFSKRLITNINPFQQKSKPTGGGEEEREVVQDQPGGW